MPVRDIELYPSEVLRQKAADADPADPAVRDAVQDLWDTLDSHTGVGIAAPQIGAPLRIIAVDATRARKPVPNHGRIALLNPEIVAREGEISFREGCMSIPDLVARIHRASRITVTGITPDGTPRTITAEGFEAVIFQHEMDHLDGVLFIDRIRNARDLKPRNRE
jgi:peptide deformylase